MLTFACGTFRPAAISSFPYDLSSTSVRPTPLIWACFRETRMMSWLLMGWYAKHRELRGAPDPVMEDLTAEVRIEDRIRSVIIPRRKISNIIGGANMSIPGFTAELALYGSGGHYRVFGATSQITDGVQLAQIRGETCPECCNNCFFTCFDGCQTLTCLRRCLRTCNFLCGGCCPVV
jgi:hypothetical protein